MSVSRRQFILGAAACACVSVAGCIGNPAAIVDAGADRSMPVPAELSKPGSQVKIRLPGQSEPILVWRTEIGFNGTSLRCTHCLSEVKYRFEEAHIVCMYRGCRYAPDGTVLTGPTKRPLKTYLVDLQGDRLRILG